MVPIQTGEFQKILKESKIQVNKDKKYNLRSTEEYILYINGDKCYIEGVSSGIIFEVPKENINKLLVPVYEQKNVTIIKKPQKRQKQENHELDISDDIIALIIKYNADGLTPSKIARKLKLKTIEVRQVLSNMK